MENSFLIRAADKTFDVETKFMPDNSNSRRMGFKLKEHNGNEFEYVANYQIENGKLIKFVVSDTALEAIYWLVIGQEVLKTLGEISG